MDNEESSPANEFVKSLIDKDHEVARRKVVVEGNLKVTRAQLARDKKMEGIYGPIIQKLETELAILESGELPHEENKDK